MQRYLSAFVLILALALFAVIPASAQDMTIEPTSEITLEPPPIEVTAEPTVEVTVEPTLEPTSELTAEPTADFTLSPTSEATSETPVQPETTITPKNDDGFLCVAHFSSGTSVVTFTLTTS